MKVMGIVVSDIDEIDPENLIEFPVVYWVLSVETEIVGEDGARPSDWAFTAPVNPKDKIVIDNIAKDNNPDTFIFNLNRASEYLYFQSN